MNLSIVMHKFWLCPSKVAVPWSWPWAKKKQLIIDLNLFLGVTWYGRKRVHPTLQESRQFLETITGWSSVNILINFQTNSDAWAENWAHEISAGQPPTLLPPVGSNNMRWVVLRFFCNIFHFRICIFASLQSTEIGNQFLHLMDIFVQNWVWNWKWFRAAPNVCWRSIFWGDVQGGDSSANNTNLFSNRRQFSKNITTIFANRWQFSNNKQIYICK